MTESQANQALAPVWKAVTDSLGHSQFLATTPAPASQALAEIAGLKLPSIPPGASTTIIPVPVALSSLRGGAAHHALAQEHAEVAAVFVLALLVWMCPAILINKRLCCSCFQRWLSRHLGCYAFFGFIFNITMISLMLAREPDISANDIFFKLVNFLEVLSEKLVQVLTQLCMVAGVLLVIAFRKKIVSLLGYDEQIVRADLRDILTLFTMNRFSPIEVSLWKAEGLPTGFTSRSLFVRAVLGYNEPQHSRPHDGCTDFVALREKMQLNYDPEDAGQKLSIVIKQQEVVGAAISQLAPVAGALVGAVGGVVTPLGPGPGAGLGIVTGIGAANSLGVEVARVDLSSVMINRLRAAAGPVQSTEVATDRSEWRQDNYTKVDLVPQGSLWLRISDVAPDE